MRRVTTYLSEVRAELSKVTWPKRSEVTKMTAMVIAISLIVALYLGVLDYSFTKMLEGLIT